jgi:two-component system nitrogen regulation sensor histidine kinase GlnL
LSSYIPMSRERGREHQLVNNTLTFCVDRDLHVTSWEKGISEFTGRSSSDALGRKYYEVFPRLVVRDRDAVRTVFDEGEKVSLREYVLSCFSSQIRADFALSPVGNGKGLIKEVEITIDPRSSCAVDMQLRNSQWLIDIGKMATTLAHGVRNPLNAIKGAVTFLRERYAEEETLTEFTEIIEEEITRLDHFISKFLSTSISDLDFSETDINVMMKKIEIVTALQSRASSIEISFDYGDIPVIKTSSFHLEQAVLSVINNAIEAMPSGGRVSVRTLMTKRSDRDYLLIEVADNGPGMAKGKMATPEAGEPSEGKGFGLFITREILQYLGGHLEFKSQKGEGTQVSLFLAVNSTAGRA